MKVSQHSRGLIIIYVNIESVRFNRIVTHY